VKALGKECHKSTQQRPRPIGGRTKAGVSQAQGKRGWDRKGKGRTGNQSTMKLGDTDCKGKMTKKEQGTGVEREFGGPKKKKSWCRDRKTTIT